MAVNPVLAATIGIPAISAAHNLWMSYMTGEVSGKGPGHWAMHGAYMGGLMGATTAPLYYGLLERFGGIGGVRAAARQGIGSEGLLGKFGAMLTTGGASRVAKYTATRTIGKNLGKLAIAGGVSGAIGGAVLMGGLGYLDKHSYQKTRKREGLYVTAGTTFALGRGAMGGMSAGLMSKAFVPGMGWGGAGAIGAGIGVTTGLANAYLWNQGYNNRRRRH